MVGFGTRGRRHALRFGSGRFGGLKFGGTVVSALVILSALFGPATAGAQEMPTAAPGFCEPLSDLLDNAYSLVVDDEEEFQYQLEEVARLIVELRRVAPPELSGRLDALAAFSSTLAAEVAAAGGIETLSEVKYFDLVDRVDAVLEPIDAFFGRSCPGANIQATLYPECVGEDGIEAPYLEVGNFSADSVEVTAGEVVFTVEADDYDYRDVPADLRAEDVLIDGVAGLVLVGSCDEFGLGLFEDGISSLFTATFTSGCPADSPPGLARLEVELTDDGEVLVDELLDELEMGQLPLPVEIDGDLILARFPAGLNLRLEADATVPEVKILDVVLPVELLEAKCGPARPGGAVAAPLAPKFTG